MITLFPIRHHGPGSAFALVEALNKLTPDIVLIEGPADATSLLDWLSHEEMEPPVALLSYRPDVPNRSTAAPFALFSPEYNAIRYAQTSNIPARFCDLPYGHLLSLDHSVAPPPSAPFARLSKIVEAPNYERWWNLFVEQRRDTTDLFQSLNELVAEMRHGLPEPDFTDEKTGPQNLLGERREAHMRQEIRRAQQEGFTNIAVVIGAWHAPALTPATITAKETADHQILDNLTLAPIEHTWIPWTYSRMSTYLGYGAGVRSPGWYHHLWEMKQHNAEPSEVAIGWLKQVADLLRAEDFESSAAHIIEAVRLAEAISAVRGLPFPGLPELTDAVQTVMCNGYAEPLKLIQRQLIVSERMGDIPLGTPQTPLQKDIRNEQKRLQIRPLPDSTSLTLDLRIKPHQERSALLHRLNLLEIPWGKPSRSPGIQQGTFREVWKLQWQPAHTIKIITSSMWGNTLVEAVSNFIVDKADQTSSLRELTDLLDKLIIADLPDTTIKVLEKIEDQSAVTSDVLHLLQAIPPLARIMRYGNVRETDQTLIRQIVHSLLTRVCIGLPTTCMSVDDKAAQELYNSIADVQPIISHLDAIDLIQLWRETLQKLADNNQVNGLIAGLACRLLFQSGHFKKEAVAMRMNRVLSLAGLVAADLNRLLWMTAWLDGFLRGSEMVLVHDKALWGLLDEWVIALPEEQFMGIVPLLRRTFSSFSESVREQLGRRIQGNVTTPTAVATDPLYNTTLADQLLPYLQKIVQPTPQ